MLICSSSFRNFDLGNMSVKEEINLETLKNNRSSLKGQITKLSNEISGLLNGSVEYGEIKTKFSKICENLNSFKEINLKINKLVSEEQIIQNTADYKIIKVKIKALKSRIKDKFNYDVSILSTLESKDNTCSVSQQSDLEKESTMSSITDFENRDIKKWADEVQMDALAPEFVPSYFQLPIIAYLPYF